MRLSLLTTTLLLGPCLAAQTTTVTSPPGLESTEGSGSGTLSQDMAFRPHSQFIDEEFVGKGVKLITQVSYRYNWTSGAGAGTNKWVLLDVGHLTTSGVSATFSNNFLGSPTRVFQSAVNFPGHTAGPKGFGPAKWVVAFPFSTPLKYDGKTGLILDYLFTANNPSHNPRFDASSQNGVAKGSRRKLASTTNACVDSRRLDPAAYELHSLTYARDLGQTALNNKLFIHSRSTDTAPSASVIHVLGLGGHPLGLSIGLACNRLHIDITIPHLLQARMADTQGSSGLNLVANAPYATTYAGFKLYGQAVWNDSLSKQMLMTYGMETTIAAQPENPSKRFMLFGGPKSSTGIVTSLPNYNPIPLYTFK